MIEREINMSNQITIKKKKNSVSSSFIIICC